MKKDMGFAAAAISTMILMLQDRYTDAEIKKMLTRKKVDAIIKVVNGDST